MVNFSGLVNSTRLLTSPRSFLPHLTIPTFRNLPIPITCPGWPTIKAVVLDKDNCFAKDQSLSVFQPYTEHLRLLQTAYPGPRLLIVSNSVGLDPTRQDVEAEAVERNTGIKVLRHATKKPGCGDAIVEHFSKYPEINLSEPCEIAVVGDRLMTDVLLANLMGALGVWVKDGVEINDGVFMRIEKAFPRSLHKFGIRPPPPFRR